MADPVQVQMNYKAACNAPIVRSYIIHMSWKHIVYWALAQSTEEALIISCFAEPTLLCILCKLLTAYGCSSFIVLTVL